jgi:hypothetical protein
MPYREAEEQIRYYAPARYLCGLTETDWTPDFTTIQDFAQLLGEDGCRLINEAVVKQAVALGLADAKVAVADMTAQEAAIPHPNEMGLLGGFVRSIEAAAHKAGQGFKDFLGKAHGKFRAAKEQLRKYRLFAKSKTKAAKNRMVAQMTSIVEGINQKLGKALAAASEQGRKLRGHAVVARRKLAELHETMGKLVPQIRHWLRTGFVASGKIISLNIPQLYSIVRGKVGKAVEFGLSWGITRLRGGFVLATMASDKTEITDSTYAVRAVEDLISAVRQGTARLRLRSRWVQHTERGATWQAWRPRYWAGPPGTRAVGGPGEGERPTHQGAGAGRRVPSAPSSAPNTDSTARLLAQPR